MDWQLVASYFTVKSTGFFYSVCVSGSIVRTGSVDIHYMESDPNNFDTYIREKFKACLNLPSSGHLKCRNCSEKLKVYFTIKYCMSLYRWDMGLRN